MAIWKEVGRGLLKSLRAVGSGLNQLVNVVQEFFNRFFGLLDFILGVFGWLPMKKIRVLVVVLSHPHGQYLIQRSEAESVMGVVREIFEREARTRVIPSFLGLVRLDPRPVPLAALDVKCGVGAWGEEFGDAGAFFRAGTAQNISGTVLGYAEPVTAFVVRDVDPGLGCSLGPLTSYVTIERTSRSLLPGEGTSTSDQRINTLPSRSLAHEIAHACGLTHPLFSDNVDNLMVKGGNGGVGTKLGRWQTLIFRNSRHVTYF